MINVSTATTAQLVAFYNEHANKPVNKFSDRKTAERRVLELLAGLKFSKPSAKNPKPAAKAPVEGSVSPERAAAIKASWTNKAVAAARAQRHAVRVTYAGRSEQYKSVREAFIQLGLPLGRHIKFRGLLKVNGRAVFDDHQFALVA